MVAPVASPMEVGAATQAPFPHRLSLVQVAAQAAAGPVSASMPQSPAFRFNVARSPVPAAPPGRPQRQEEPETLWERWWPFAFAMSPPQLDEKALKETNKRRRERLRKLRKYDEGRDLEQFTDSNMDDSSHEDSANEQRALPEAPAGHYSKAHPHYKKLRLPSGRRVDITRRNYFLRELQ
ncbi:hypothetical protein MRX96_020940 [Rhipicephalus microplus]